MLRKKSAPIRRLWDTPAVMKLDAGRAETGANTVTDFGLAKS